jgi:multidrug efflux pump subunit AcrB
LAKLAEMAKSAPPGLTIEPLAFDRETLVDVPADGFLGVGALAHLLRADPATSGRVVVERCRALPLDREAPDEVVVMSSLASAAPALADASGARVVPGGPAQWVRIFGPDFAELTTLSDRVAAAADKLGIAVTGRVGNATVPQLTIIPDRAALARYGLNRGDVEMLIRLASGEAEVGTSYEGERRLAITMRLGTPGDLQAIRALVVATSDDSIVPLGQLATIRQDASPRAILRANGQRFVTLRVHADDDARDALSRAIKQIAMPAGYRVEFADRMAPTASP